MVLFLIHMLPQYLPRIVLDLLGGQVDPLHYDLVCTSNRPYQVLYGNIDLAL